MIRKPKQYLRACLLPIVVLLVSACGGGGGGGDNEDAGGDGNTTAGEEPNASGSTIVPLSSLGPLMPRLYPPGTNRQLLTGPVIGEDLATTPDLIREIPFEVTTKAPELEVEKTYVLRVLPVTELTGPVMINNDRDPAYYMVTVLTNVSNRMLCDIRIRDAQFEATDGEKRTTSDSLLFGYMARDAAANHYEQDCIPPGLSAFAIEFFFEPEVFANDFNADNPGKFVIDQIDSPIRDSYEPFDDLYASSYVSDSNDFHRHRYSVNIVNPSTRTYDERIVQDGIVLMIDPATGLPLMEMEFSRHDDRPASFDTFNPGAEGEFQFVAGSRFHEFAGSTNTIFVWINHIDEGN